MSSKNKISPKVSIIITCFNYADYVQKAIESALDQSYDNIELIIINDGSTDNSLDVINLFSNKATIISRSNKGIVYTRNEGLKLAKGEYICFLDADDYFNKDYIRDMLEISLKHKSDVVYPNWRVFGEKEYYTNFPEFDIQKLIKQEIHCTSESLVRKEAVGNNSFKSERVAEDWDFFLGMALSRKRFKLAKNCFINYRVRKNTRGSSRPYWEDMYYFCKILEKWNKKYPKVVNQYDLPIHAGIERDKHIESQNKIISEKDKAIGQNVKLLNVKETAIKDRDLQIISLNKDIENIINSRSYRIGRVITSPYVKIRNLISKNDKADK